MQDSKRYLRWCLDQNRGIRQVKPSENLVRAYLDKSRNALKSMEVNAKEGIIEWAVCWILCKIFCRLCIALEDRGQVRDP